MNLSYGSRGDSVRDLQRQLNSRGYKLDEDGVFGNNTLAAVRDYQSKNGLDVDGIAGSKTMSSLQRTAPAVQNTTVRTGTLTDYNRGYTPSAAVTAAEQYLKKVQSQKPGEYQSPYAGQLDAMYAEIVGRKPFEYDLNSDMLYQQYRQQYENLGKRAMQDTMGQAAGLTGGYGSTYSQNAGQQAYQNYLQQLNDKVPDLYRLALEKYEAEGDEKYRQYGLLNDRENAAYGRYRDQVGDWADEYSRAYGRYGDERNFDYGSWSDMRNYLYQQERDRVADEQWERQFAAAQAARAAASSGGGGGGGGGGGDESSPSLPKGPTITSNKREESAAGMGTTSYTNVKRTISAALGMERNPNKALNLVNSSWDQLNNNQRAELKKLLASYGYQIKD